MAWPDWMTNMLFGGQAEAYEDVVEMFLDSGIMEIGDEGLLQSSFSGTGYYQHGQWYEHGEGPRYEGADWDEDEDEGDWGPGKSQFISGLDVESGVGSALPTEGQMHTFDWAAISSIASAKDLAAWMQYGAYEYQAADLMTEALSEQGYEGWLDFAESFYEDFDRWRSDLDTSGLEGSREKMLQGISDKDLSQIDQAYAQEAQIGATGFESFGGEMLSGITGDSMGVGGGSDLLRAGYREEVYAQEEDWASDFWGLVDQWTGIE